MTRQLRKLVDTNTSVTTLISSAQAIASGTANHLIDVQDLSANAAAEARVYEQMRVRPEVMRSVERTLSKYAELWSDLAKY